MKSEKKKIALYDIDYTIISVNSLLLFLFFVLKKRKHKIFYLPILIIKTILWGIGIISTLKIKSEFLYPIKGLNKEEIDLICNEFVSNILIPKIKPEAVKNIEENRKKGYLIIFATASYEIYMNILCKYLKADYYYGTKIKYENNILTDEIDGPNCKDKEKIIRILKDITFDKIEKSGSVGYSDSLTDLPFLDLVETFYKISLKKWKITKIYTSEKN